MSAATQKIFNLKKIKKTFLPLTHTPPFIFLKTEGLQLYLKNVWDETTSTLAGNVILESVTGTSTF